MPASITHSLGKPPRCEPFPEPIPGDGEVIVHVRAAALKPVDKQMASGSHYASFRDLPAKLCGLDGVGNSLDDGTPCVLRCAAKAPWGDGATHRCSPFPLRPLPGNVDDVSAAAIVNPRCVSLAHTVGARETGPRRPRPGPRRDRHHWQTCGADSQAAGCRTSCRRRTRRNGVEYAPRFGGRLDHIAQISPLKRHD